MRKLFVGCLLIVLLTIQFNSILPANAQTATPSTVATMNLKDCPLTVGLGDVKHDVRAQCGVLSVPEDYAHPTQRTLDIHVVVLPALKADAKGAPIFHLEGGPGGSAISDFGLAWYGAYEGLRQDHPVVLIDQRGTGLSASLACTESKSAADYTKLPTKNDAANSLKALQTCLKRLSQTTDPQFYTSASLADDTDAVRAALGYDQIDLFGNSYGTWLAQIYLKRHGTHVAAAILDSVTGPWNNPFLDSANNGQVSLDKLFALCKTDSDCNAAYPDLAGSLQKALATLKANPQMTNAVSLTGDTSHEVGMTADRLLEAIYEMLYNSANWALIPAAIQSAANGNYLLIGSTLFAESEFADSISEGLYLSVVCAEDAAFYTPALIKHYVSKSLFSALNPPDQQIAECKVWHSATVKKADVAPVVSDRPTLILSGDLDPVTPVKYGQETHARLSHSTLAVLPYQGHGVIVNSKCAQDLAVTFLAAPSAKLDTSCAEQDLKPRFYGAFPNNTTLFTSNKATFRGNVPAGWLPEQDGPLTFFTSPDKTQFLAAGVYKNSSPADAQAALLSALGKHFGAIDVQQGVTQSAMGISITLLIHTMTTAEQAEMGLILLRPVGNDVYAVWQAAPANWFQAAALTNATFMIALMAGN
jgi:pimeloyl-ACP methyl ester carboxylesterase